jgi:hypothetical protein
MNSDMVAWYQAEPILFADAEAMTRELTRGTSSLRRTSGSPGFTPR